MIGMTINSTELRQTLKVAERRLENTRPLMADLGKTIEVEVRAHFRKRNAQPNKKGWPKRNFWEREGAQNTALTHVDANSAEVSIASPAIAHKIKGGVIKPKRARALAIPLRAEAYMAGSPREWDRPEKLFRPKGKRYLAITDGSGALRVMYLLVSSVNQKADPDTLPTKEKLAAAMNKRAEAFLVRAITGLESGVA